MKRALVTTTLLAFALATASPLFAAEKSTKHKTPEQTCSALAKKEHITKHKHDAYMKSCIEKHSAKMPKHSTTKPKHTSEMPTHSSEIPAKAE